MAEREGFSSGAKGKQETQQFERPDPALKRLEILVDTWKMRGHTLDSKVDNITGWSTFEWLPGKFFLESFGEITIQGFHFNGFVVKALEIIAYDPKKKKFPSTVYSNLSGEVLAYEWDVQGSSVIHSGLGAKYIGTLSGDGNTLTGGWRSGKGTKDAEGNAYDVVMTKMRRRTRKAWS
jgi:hypothetical protein